MIIIPDKKKRSWLAYNENAGTLESLKKRILSADVCLTDLDGTDAPSPTFNVAVKAIGTSHFDRQYSSWVMQTVLAKANKTPGAESTQWRSYKDTFLSTTDARKDVADMFCSETVRNSLFPGVEKFYQSLGIDCFYVTRSIGEVAKAYGKVLGFQGVYPDEFRKDRGVERFIENGGGKYSRFIVKGDSDEDFEMLRFLRWCVLQGKIDDVIGIYVPKRKQDTDSRFEIQIGNGRYDHANNFLWI